MSASMYEEQDERVSPRAASPDFLPITVVIRTW